MFAGVYGRSMRRILVLIIVALVSVLPTVFVTASRSSASGQTDQYPTVDGQYSGTGVIPARGFFTLQVAGRGGVPASGAGAVAVNVTVTNPTASSFLTVYPTGQALPTAANLVFSSGQTVPNMVVVKLGTNGQITMYNYGGNVDVIVDVQGWFPADSSFTGLTPARLMDTRPGYPTIDSQYSGTGSIGASATTDLVISGRGGVPATDVGAVALNITVVGATRDSYLTAFPSGASRPTAANLNYRAGQTVPNMVIAKLGAGGAISLYNFAGNADLVVDVLGWFPATGSFVGLTPARLLETRGGLPTIDGQSQGGGPVGPNGLLALTVVNRGGVPATGVGAVALNVAVTSPTATSFLTAFPSDAPSRPTAANLNFTAGQTVPNMIIVKVGANGQITLFNFAGSTDIVVDVLGWFPAGSGYTGLTPARLMDSRTIAPPPTTTTTTTTTTAPPTTNPPTTQPPAASIKPGTYTVNGQIAPGRYTMPAAKNGCYWERLSGFSGTLDDIIVNDFQAFNGVAIIDIAGSDAGFDFDGDCGNMRLYTPPAALTPFFAAGAFIVGQDIPAGTYTSTAVAGCYWERNSGMGGSLDDVNANDYVSTGGQQIVTIQPSDVGFHSNDKCGTWVLNG